MSNWLLPRRIDRPSARRIGVDGPDSRLRDDAVAQFAKVRLRYRRFLGLRRWTGYWLWN